MSLPQPPVNPADAPIDAISTADILSMRKVLDDTSWSYFSDRTKIDRNDFLRIDSSNRFLIEGFNWFGTEGLSSIFENYVFTIPGTASIYVTSHKIEYPRAESLSEPGKFLFPNMARTAKSNYTGTLFVNLKVVWTNGNESTIQDVPFGKIPIMVGSQFCNLTNRLLVNSLEDLKKVGEDEKEPLGFFVMNGNSMNLISQNYLKINTPICIMSKMSDRTTTAKTHLVVDIRSKAPDGSMFKHRIFIMRGSGKKPPRNDPRLYMQIQDIIKKNLHDEGSQALGVNAVSIFRMIMIFEYTLNPILPTNSYTYMDTTQGQNLLPGGFWGRSTYNLAVEKFKYLLRQYAGDTTYDMAKQIIDNTVNEASLEEGEGKFWGSMVSLYDNIGEQSSEKNSLYSRAKDLQKKFGNITMPHVSPILFSRFRGELERDRENIKQELNIWIIEREPVQSKSKLAQTVVEASPLQKVDAARTILSTPFEKLNPIQLQLYNKWELAKFKMEPTYIRALTLFDQMKRTLESKMEVLAYMMVKIIRVTLELDVMEDRDSLANQMYEHAGIMMISRMASMFRAADNKFSNYSSRSDDDGIRSMFTQVGEDIITNEFKSNFAKNEWNSKNAKKTRSGVIADYPSSVVQARTSSLRRLSFQGTEKSKILSFREISGLQPGSVCPSNTPEGKQCGKVTHLAAAATITTGSYDHEIWMYELAKKRSSRRRPDLEIGKNEGPLTKNFLHRQLRHMTTYSNPDEMSEEHVNQYLISTQRSKERDCPLFLDGIPMGWVDSRIMRRYLISLRRDGLINPGSGIHFIQKVTKGGIIRKLSMETGSGRIIQPLIIAEDPRATVAMFRMLYADAKEGKYWTVADMFERGYIEYVDAAELDFLDVAASGSDYLRSIQDGNYYRYDHIMLNPAFLMGFVANLQPFASMNAPVRNSYFTNMVRQPADAASPSFIQRADTGVSVLLTPQEPIVKTDVYDALFNKDVFGMNVKLLIAPYIDGEEDGVVIRRGFVENGGLSSIKYSAYPITVKNGQQLNFGDAFHSAVDDPDRYGKGTIRVTKKVVRVDENGEEVLDENGKKIIDESPVYVNPGDILARTMYETGNDTAFSDLKFDSLRQGQMDRIMWSKSLDKSKIVYFIIKFPDDLYIGDKIASRYSQKGVIVKVVDDEDMYRDAETGEMPDLIINPQAFPSRMTPGMLAEMLVANAHIWPDRRRSPPILFNDKGFDIFAPTERLYIINSQELENWETQLGYTDETTKLSPILYPSNTNIPKSPIMQSHSGRRSEEEGESNFQSPTHTGATTLVSSESIYDQQHADFLDAKDLSKTFLPGTTIQVLRIYGTPTPIDNPIENPLVNPYRENQETFTKDIRYAIIIPVENPGGQIGILNIDDDRVKFLYRLSDELRARISYVLEVPNHLIENIPGLWFDTEREGDKERDPNVQLDEEDPKPELIHPQKGIRISNLPDAELFPAQNSLAHLGKSVREAYIRGNSYTPVAHQMICAYRNKFFTRENVEFYHLDYIIPDDMLKLEKIRLPGEKEFTDQFLPSGIKLSIFKSQITKIEALRKKIVKDGPKAPLEEVMVELTWFELWNQTYSLNHPIPKENIIDLPPSPSELFSKRTQVINNLRKATAFKEGLDVHDARKELQMMGYQMDMKRTFIKGSGPNAIVVNGGVVSGWNYYMPLSHKVDNKVQARGNGKYDSRTGQPIKGRVNGGGIRFPFPDALAVRRSGAQAVVEDRLLHASGGKSIYVCEDCGEECYRLGKNHKDCGTIICPMCKNQARGVKIQIPYISLYMRNLMIAAGVRFKLNVGLK